MFSHRGDSNEYTQYTIFNIKKKITLNYPKSAVMGFFHGTQERVRNSRGKRAISVRGTEILYFAYKFLLANSVDPDQKPHSVPSELSLHC